jgi:hypothetical protein
MTVRQQHVDFFGFCEKLDAGVVDRFGMKPKEG